MNSTDTFPLGPDANRDANSDARIDVQGDAHIHLQTHSLAELAVLADLPPRTVRYYVQLGLVDRPEGETRAARYGARHLEQLLLIRKWTAAGVSLDRVRELLQGQDAPVPPRPHVAGAIEVCSHLTVTDGIEVVIEPGRAGLSPEQMRRFVRAVIAAYDEVRSSSQAASEVRPEPARESKPDCAPESKPEPTPPKGADNGSS